MMNATDSLGKQWGSPGLADAGPPPADGRSQEYKDWHAKTFAPVRDQQREYGVAAAKAHIDAARTARGRGDSAAAARSLSRASLERRIAAQLRSR